MNFNGLEVRKTFSKILVKLSSGLIRHLHTSAMLGFLLIKLYLVCRIDIIIVIFKKKINHITLCMFIILYFIRIYVMIIKIAYDRM